MTPSRDFSYDFTEISHVNQFVGESFRLLEFFYEFMETL